MNLEATVDAQLSAGLGAGPLLIAAALGFVLALVLLSVLPSLALFFVPASSSAEATQTKQLKQPDTATNPHKGEQQNEEGKEESGGHHLHEGKAKEVSCTEDDVTTDQEDVSSVAVEDHLPKAPLAMSPDNQRDGHQAHPPTNAVVIVTDPQDAPKTIDAHNNHNEDNDLDGDDENGTGLASSPSFPRVRTEPGLGVEAQQYQPPKLKPKPTLRRATVATTASSLEHASVADSLVPSPVPSIYSFLSSSSGGGVGGVSLGSSVSAVDSTSTAAAAASDPSPSLASASSYPPHTAVTIETSSPPTPSSSTSSSSSSSSSSSNLLAVASAHVRPTGRLVRGQSNFLEAVKLGQLRDSEATSSLPNPAVHQWWEMERLLEKEYATIEEKAFGVMMKLMPFRSGEGLKDPPKIVPNPYHGNRVVLSALEDALPEHDTTFYNASYIKKGQFIAASMPHNDLTRQDFWRMIYEQDSRLIVMLNLEDESHGDAYWPNELNRTTHYGPMAITKTEQMRMRFYESTVRKFTITRTDQPDAPAKQVLHVHNTVWPDKGIPENVEAFTDMVEYVKQEYEQLCENKTGPMTVHCFGGIGRTGSFLTCMICLLSIRENQEANVFNTVLNLRTDRAMMVQTKEQYKFCYRVVMELLSRSKRKALHRGLSGVLRRSSARKKPPFQDGFASAPSPRVTEL